MRTIAQILLLSIASLLLICKTSSAQKRWITVGAKRFSTVSYSTSIAIDSGGTPYVAFIDTANNDEVIVNKYDGTNWVKVGNTGFYAQPSFSVWITVDDTGVPYVAFPDYNNDSKLAVIKYDGGSWSQVGTAGLSVNLKSTGGNPLAAGKNGVVYAVGNVLGKAAVVKYDATNWSPVGNLSFSDTVLTYASMAVDSKGYPCIAFEDDSIVSFTPNPPTYIIMKRVTVMKYNGNKWETLGGVGYKILNAWDPTINFDSNDTAYVSYTDRGNQYKASVRKFYDTSVAIVGSLGFAAGGTAGAIIDKNDVPHIGCAGGNSMEVRSFDGTSWILEGKTGFTNATVWRYSMAYDDKSDFLYVAFLESGINKITVVKYDYCLPEQKMNICSITTDTMSNANTVVWDTSNLSQVDSYIVYRADVGSYTRIASVKGNINFYADLTANTSAKSYKYKVTLLDSCKQESNMDSVAAHKTVRLVFNSLFDGKASISWNSYEGMSSPIYTIMRSNNNYTYVPIANFSITGNDTTYIDMNPPSGSNRYRIDIALANPCNTGSSSYSKITSNVATSWTTYVDDILKSERLVVTPNPAGQEVTVYAKEAIENVEIFSLTSKLIVSESGTKEKEMKVDTGILTSGTYILRVNRIHKAVLVKQ